MQAELERYTALITRSETEHVTPCRNACSEMVSFLYYTLYRRHASDSYYVTGPLDRPDVLAEARSSTRDTGLL